MVPTAARTILALLFLAASVRSAEDEGGAAESLPYPFAPPSDEFCASNQLGDDVYISIFEPCDFTFYRSSDLANTDRFSCQGVENAEIYKTQQRKVVLWPDSCVATGPRCYDLTSDEASALANFTVFADTEFAMDFPRKATAVQVDCTSDYAKAQEFLDHLPEELPAAARSLTFAGVAFLFAGVAFLAMGLCCLCGGVQMCFCPSSGGRRTTQSSYAPVPATAVPPPVATKMEAPAYQAVV